MKLKEDGKMREDLRHLPSVNKQAFHFENELRPYYARRRILKEQEELKKLKEARANSKKHKKNNFKQFFTQLSIIYVSACYKG